MEKLRSQNSLSQKDFYEDALVAVSSCKKKRKRLEQSRRFRFFYR